MYVLVRKKGNKMKKSVKLVMIIVLLMAGGCATQKKEENTRIIDTSMFLYKVSDKKGYSYLFGTCHPGRYPIKSLDKVTEKALDESDSIYLECDMKPSPKETEEITKYNTYNSIRDLGLEDKYENLMKQYKSLKGKPGYALYNVFVINSLINSDPEVLNKANISKFSAIDNYIYEYAQKKKNFKEVEGIEFQMKLLTELSGDYSETILDNLANKEMVIKSAKEDLDAYYSGNTQYYEDEQNLLLNQLEQLNDSDKEKYEKYWNILAYNRNIHMKDTLADGIHNNKHDFIGVGCKHLYGKKGIIQLLKDDGYLVECMK